MNDHRGAWGGLRRGNGLKATSMAQQGPLGTQPTPALGFPWAESERGKAFPVPGPGQTLPAPACPGPCWDTYPLQGSPEGCQLPQSTSILPPTSPRGHSNKLITQSGGRPGNYVCPLRTHTEGQLSSVCWAIPGFCPWDAGWDAGENWGAGACHWRMPGKQRGPSTRGQVDMRTLESLLGKALGRYRSPSPGTLWF